MSASPKSLVTARSRLEAAALSIGIPPDQPPKHQSGPCFAPHPASPTTHSENSSLQPIPGVDGVETDLPVVLARWRQHHQLKISSSASALGVATATWGHWERGTRFPNGRNLELLSRLTGLSIRALLCAHYDECPFRHRGMRNPSP